MEVKKGPNCFFTLDWLVNLDSYFIAFLFVFFTVLFLFIHALDVPSHTRQS